MWWWRKLRRRWRALFRKRDLDAEMEEELRFHVEMLAQANLEEGLDRQEAHYAALRQFGWVEKIKETCREQRGVTWLEQLGQDLGYGLRMLVKNPGFAAVSVLTLALGIGASSAILHLVNKVMLNPIPSANAEQLVDIRERSPRGQWTFVSPPLAQDLLGQTNLFSSASAFHYVYLILPGKDFADGFNGLRTTPEFFDILGVPPLLGQTFDVEAGQAGKGRVLVINYRFWQQRFHSDPEIIGKTIKLSGQSYTIIGVMPPSFQFPSGPQYSHFWMPHVFGPADLEPGRRTDRSWGIIARVQPGLAPSQVEQGLNDLSRRLAGELPGTYGGWGLRAVSARWAFYRLPGNTFHFALLCSLAAALMLLIITCINIANLMLARAEARRKEIAVRIAIGAGRFRLVRMLLAESLMLAWLGGAAGLSVAWLGIQWINSHIPIYLPRLRDLGMDWGTVALTGAISVLAGVGFGLASAWRASQTTLGEALKESGPFQSLSARRQRVLQGLVVAEVGLTAALLVAGGLMRQSVTNLLRTDLGFDPKGLAYVVFRSIKPQTQRRPEQDLWDRDVAERLLALPGVQAVATFKETLGGRFCLEGTTNAADLRFVGVGIGSQDYFEALRVPLLAGRRFEAADALPGRRTIIINQELAWRCWPGEDPIGKRIAQVSTGSKVWLEVVGVVGNVKNWPLLTRYSEEPTANGVVGHIKSWRLEKLPEPIFYLPCHWHGKRLTGFLVRVSTDPASLVKPVNDLARAIGPEALPPVFYFLEREIHSLTDTRRTLLKCLALFGMTALALCAVGIYGVLSYAVVQRNKELGIRMMLGATQGKVLAMVLGQGARLVAFGLAAGLATTFVLARLFRSLLHEVDLLEPWVLAGATLGLSLVALGACLAPARRAVRVDPLTALRFE